MPDLNVIVAPPKTGIKAALEPAHNILNSLMLLNKSSHLSGLDDWLSRANEKLTAEQRHTNRVVVLGLFYALTPRESWSSFPAYVDSLADLPAVELRDRVLEAYATLPCRFEEVAEPATAVILASPQSFIDYLYTRFPPDYVDEEIEKEAYIYLKDPQALKNLIVNHLRDMWQTLMADEWRRNRQLLRDCIDAVDQLDLARLSPLEAARQVVGDELPEWWEQALADEEAEQLIFVPSAHLGPYLGKFKYEETLWILFGARQPQGVRSASPDLNRSELLVRLNALADDNRLRILHLLHLEGELCSPDIIDKLTLSQSAASRHLKQLSATGYVQERRVEGAKCYRLNEERIENTFDALAYFLLG